MVRPPDCRLADLRSILTSSLAWLSNCGKVAISLVWMALSSAGGRYMSMEPLLWTNCVNELMAVVMRLGLVIGGASA